MQNQFRIQNLQSTIKNNINYLHINKLAVKLKLVGLSVLIIWFVLCLPDNLFNSPYSTILNDRRGNLLAAQIAKDGQWRFPIIDTVPKKFREAIILFEDEYFYYHPGINPFSFFRAFRENISAGKIVQGGSTLSMQVIRLSRINKNRSILEKLKESILALRLEFSYNKEDILKLYASHAPFGGNVVGLEAAAWRYYGRSPNKLSWAESATLAVLPNAPSLIYPGKNHKLLLKKRNHLLNKLRDHGKIDSLSCELAKLETLPQKPKSLPQLAPHLLERCKKEGKRGQRIQTSIDVDLQCKCNKIIDCHLQKLLGNDIHNAAVLVIGVKNGDVLAYVGNTNDTSEHSGKHVDMITAKRSSGSILKPILYALMLKDGLITPKMLIPDIPTRYRGFKPNNFNKKFDGAVPASNALARSLNIPAVRMLNMYGLQKFHQKLKQLNFSSINKPSNYYGLTLILGGAEIRMWDLARVYSGMARMVNDYSSNSSLYRKGNYFEPYYDKKFAPVRDNNFSKTDFFTASAAWLTFEALTDMNRPEEGINWDLFESSKKIAWKTGTSYGFRDAWAVGITPDYVIVSWAGNADGEGRNGLTGASAAAPIMFDVYNALPSGRWFSPPYDDLIELRVCKESGHIAGPYCNVVDTIYSTPASENSRQCPYHRQVLLDKEERFLVNANGYPVSNMVRKNWFVLPPLIEWYYKIKNPFYKKLPPLHPDCKQGLISNIDLIYPKSNTKIYIPYGFGQIRQKIIFEAAHRFPNVEIYWHIDDEFVGSTIHIHQIEIDASVGIHTLTLVSEDGEMISRKFEVLKR